MLDNEQIIKRLSSIETMCSILKQEASQLKGMLGVSTPGLKKGRSSLTMEERERRLAKAKRVMFKQP